MHSKIFQISNRPINKDDYASPESFYESSFADYIGDEVDDKEERRDYIESLAKTLEGVFTLNEDYSLTYNGKDALHEFLTKWVDYLQGLTANLTADNIFSNVSIDLIRYTCNTTHKDCGFRFYIEDWNYHAGPLKDLVEYAANQLRDGDRIYIGAIVDYHF